MSKKNSLISKALLLGPLISLSSISGCAVYRIGEIQPPIAAKAVEVSKKSSERAQGEHCFEPLFHILSIGIIPTHCVETYNVVADNESGEVKVTSMQGWIPLLFAITPNWQYGYVHNIEQKIEARVNGGH